MRGSATSNRAATCFIRPPQPVPGGSVEKYVYAGFFDADAARRNLLARTDDTADVTILSNEAWVGHPFSGGIAYKEFAERIKAVVPQPRLLVITRAQEDMILSAYAHFVVVSGGRCRLEQFLSSRYQNQIPWLTPLYFCFHILVEEYRRLFGAENVLVLPFELLKTGAATKMVEAIYRFVGLAPPEVEIEETPSNARNYSDYAVLSRLRLLNALSPPSPANGNASLNLSRLHRALTRTCAAVLPRAVQNRVVARDRVIAAAYFKPYAAFTNRRLQAYVDVDLAALGYNMG